MKKTFRRILSALLVAVMLVCIAPLGGNIKASAFASSGQCGENVYWTFDESTGLLTISGEGAMCSDYCGENPFYDNDEIKAVVIESGVTCIDEYAFISCDELTSVIIPDSVTNIVSIGMTHGAFHYCTNLASIIVDSNNKVYDSRDNCNAIIETASNNLMVGCKNTIIPNSVTNIEGKAFEGCTGLTSLAIPNSVTNIYYEAFYGCTGLTSVTIPESVTNIGDSAFLGCTNLTDIVISDSVESIGRAAFNDTAYYNNQKNWKNSSLYGNNALYVGNHLVEVWDSFSGALEINAGTKTIASEAVRAVSGLTSVTIPDSVTSIGRYAFSGCTGLTNITIPDSVTSIGASAFSGCTGLTSITISDGVTSIGNGAFYGCTGLTDITISDSVTSIGGWTFDKTGFYNNPDKWENGALYIHNYLISVDDSVTGEYEIKKQTKVVAGGAFLNCKNLSKITIPDSVTSIGGSAFYGCTGLTSITISDGVTSIGNGAFYGCTGLTDITISDSVTDIGREAFKNCTGLTSVTIPDSVTSIGEYAFDGCTGLTSITVGNNVTSIEGWTFDGCTGLTSITMSGNVTSIGEYAFCDCTCLTRITIPDSVTSIGRAAFCYCIGLMDITIPDSVTSIGDWAFSNCTDLTSITIPDSVTSMGASAFYGCNGLASITIPDSVTSIGASAFYGCNDLASITIPDGVTRIGEYAFCFCYGLTSITIPDSVTSIGRFAFEDCDGLTNITIPGNVTSIGAYAFYGCNGLASITIPDSVKSIGDSAFGGCDELTSITVDNNNNKYDSRNDCNAVVETATNTLIFGCKNTFIPDSVTSIGNDAFAGCIELTSIAIPDSVTSIGCDAFNCCYNLTDVYYTGSESEWNEIAIASSNECLSNATIHYNYSGSHTHTLKHITVPSTCKVAGTEYDICEDCGEKLNETTLPLAAHTWDDWSIVEAPTETANGTGKRTCSVCGASESIELAYKEDKESKVQLMFPYMPNTTIVVKDETQTIGDLLQAGLKTHKLYDITMLKDDKPIQPDGTVTVRIPVPNDFDRSRARVYHIKSRNPIVREEIPSRIEGNEQDGYFIVFKTNHFSYFAIVEESRNVKSVSIGDITLNYKKSTTLNLTITADEGAEYTVKFSSSNPSVARVDENGNVYAAKKGSATITCTVTDSNGNTVTDTCNVKVKYSFGQWLIVIILFGWIWY